MGAPSVESRVLPAYDTDATRAAQRVELRRYFAACRRAGERMQPHDMLRAHRAGMPMGEIALLSGVDVITVRNAIVSSWGRLR